MVSAAGLEQQDPRNSPNVDAKGKAASDSHLGARSGHTPTHKPHVRQASARWLAALGVSVLHFVRARRMNKGNMQPVDERPPLGAELVD